MRTNLQRALELYLDAKMNRFGGLGRDWITKETLLLLGIALGVRVVLSVAQVLYGVRGFPGLSLSTWNDFYVVYSQWLDYVHKGLIPYRDFYTYKYTPLFLYTLYPFFLAAGDRAAAVPIVFSDAATAVLIYLIAKSFAGNRVAFAAGLLYAFAPFPLYYEGYLWLSSQPMTFFVILAVYFFRGNRPVLSFAALAVATMFKQQALFILPAYLILYLKDHRANLPKGVVVFIAVVVAVSLPFLIVAPTDYVGSLNYFQLYLGPMEPASPVAASIANVPALQPNPLGTCGVQTIPGLFSGTLCGSIINTKQFAASLVAGRLNQVASFLAPLLLVLLAPALYVCRRSRNFFQMLCAYSLLASLVFFADFVEPSLGYYFVPVYALMFASVIDKRTLLLGLAVVLLSATIPEGPFQVILPLGYLFALVALQGLQGSPRSESPTTVF